MRKIFWAKDIYRQILDMYKFILNNTTKDSGARIKMNMG